MDVNPDMIQRIMGAPDSPTAKLVAMRRTPPPTGDLETGVWYSNFSRVKAEADRRGLPLVAMWTNGDLCGFCKRFTGNIITDEFVLWMQTSKCLFWLGGSMDANDEDRRGGRGFNYCRGPSGNVNYFPFVSVSKTVNGQVVNSFYGSGHDYDGRLKAPDGTPGIIVKIHNVIHTDNPIVVPKIEDLTTAKKEAPTAPAVPSAQAPAVTRRLAIRINPDWDAAHIARFQSALKDNGGHCICQAGKTSDTMCMCKAFLMQREPGKCHCGAFEKFVVG